MLEITTVKEVKLQLGLLCKQKRKAYELSQEELAGALGLSRNTIQKFEMGKNATLDTVLKIIEHFNLLTELKTALQKMQNEDDITSLY